MPYIPKEAKPRVRKGECMTAGELNFAFTDLMVRYVKEFGLSYRTINDCVGALEGAKLEFYRRIAGPYEDKKIQENGDVYEDILGG